MTVAYNVALSSSYGGCCYGVSVPQYVKVSGANHLNNNKLSATISQNYTSSPRDQSTLEIRNQKKGTGNSIAPYLQIPSSINDSRGSLAEFTARIACLFWFEKAPKLKAIEESSGAVYSLVPEAIPTIGFQKWVTTILTTTQVSQNVILLALLFICRLKKFNPGVRGKKGSEFRLMTIALMMGNKFLDDNTYTNKTWAEVSGISVQEIHIMEVEFLSNVRYNLFVSKEEWEQWHVKLSRFADYFDRASCAPAENELVLGTPILPISPDLTSVSGPNTQPVSPASKLPSPVAVYSSPQESWDLLFNGLPYPSRSSQRRLPETAPHLSIKKRNWDGPMEDYPMKRVAMSNSFSSSLTTLAPMTAVTSVPVLPPVAATTSVPSVLPLVSDAPRLPRPTAQQTSNPAFPSLHGDVCQPPANISRTMSSAYQTPTAWIPQISTTSSIAPAPAPPSLYTGTIPLPDPGRRQSPFSVSSATISPALSAYSAQPPTTHLSPSFFLTNRNSPYRPVRAVNTLLIPPPLASLHQSRNLTVHQMHYQPLGKAFSERKAGVLPYVHLDTWPQGQMTPSSCLAG